MPRKSLIVRIQSLILLAIVISSFGAAVWACKSNPDFWNNPFMLWHQFVFFFQQYSQKIFVECSTILSNKILIRLFPGCDAFELTKTATFVYLGWASWFLCSSLLKAVLEHLESEYEADPVFNKYPLDMFPLPYVLRCYVLLWFNVILAIAWWILLHESSIFTAYYFWVFVTMVLRWASALAKKTLLGKGIFFYMMPPTQFFGSDDITGRYNEQDKDVICKWLWIVLVGITLIQLSIFVVLWPDIFMAMYRVFTNTDGR